MLAFGSCRGDEILYEQPLSRAPFHIVVPLKAADSSLTFILDTGSAFNFLDPSLTAHLLLIQSGAEISVVGKTRSADAYVSPAFSLGTWQLPKVSGLEIDCAPFRELEGFNVRGILGRKAISGAALKLDYDRQKVQFITLFEKPQSAAPYMPGSSRTDISYVAMSCANALQTPAIRTSLGEQSIDWVIDTGFTFTMCLRHELFEKFLAEGLIGHLKEKQTIPSETAAGPMNSREGRFLKGELLGVDLTDIPVQETPAGNNLGLLFLMNFNLIMDFGGNRLYFQRRDAEPPINHYIMLGCVFSFSDGRCQVKKLSTGGGAAETAGLRVGDRILRVGSMSGADLTVYSVYDFCETHAQQTFEVEYAREGMDGSKTTQLRLPAKEYTYPPRKVP